MFSIQKNYKNTRNNIEGIQIDGEGKIMDTIWYYIVPEQTRQDLSNKLREHLELPVQ